MYYRQCENNERADLLLKKNEKHWMNDSMSLAQKTGVFLVKIEVTENLVTLNISLKRQQQIQVAKFNTEVFIGQCLFLNTHLPELRDASQVY